MKEKLPVDAEREQHWINIIRRLDNEMVSEQYEDLIKSGKLSLFEYEIIKGIANSTNM